MKNIRRLLPLAFLVVMMLSPIFVTPQGAVTNVGHPISDNISDTRLVDIGNGEFIELGPNEELHRFILTDQGWTEWTGVSDPLVGSEYGNSTNIFNDQQMSYIPGSGTTNVQVNIPTGTGWEAYQADVSITSLTENRTWITNPGFEGGTTGWTSGISNVGSYSTPTILWRDDGHALNDDCIEVDINTNSGGAPYYYDANDRAAYRQATTVTRGTVVWSAFRLDYWADTQDDEHYGMTGSFRLYTNIEGVDVWREVFSDIGAEETWYNTGLTFVDPSTFNLPGDTTITTEIGLLSLASVGYAPNIHPRARFDNVELFLKTLVDPSEITLEMNSLTISDGASRGTCSITQIPGSPWTANPVPMTFSWTPIPSTPNPNNVVYVDFHVSINMLARRLDTSSHYEIGPTSFGERFSITNGTDAQFTSYFRANIPSGYSNFYYFTETIPTERDIYFVGEPLAPTTNVTSGWTGGNPGDGLVTVTTYDITSEPGRYGYWRILSNSPNMITDLELEDPSGPSWSRNVNLRAGDTSRVRVNVGSQFEDSVVNITIYEPDGSIWNTYQTTVDSAGYATTSYFVLDGSSAPAGDWMVQANTNNFGADGEWTSVGLFKRQFSITHASNIDLTYPSDAVGTMITNVTFGDLLLIILEVEDTDSSVLVPGGTMILDWNNGTTDVFDDSGNGQYTKVIDTSTLPGKGQYFIDFDWTHPSFDPDSTSLTINLNYAASLTSPDYPGIEGPVGDDQSFTVLFKNVNGTGIPSGNVWCDWSNPYTVTPLGLGQFEISLDMSGIAIATYPVNIYASESFVEPQSMIMYVEVREIYNSITYTANELSIPLGETGSFLLTWTDTDHGTPITGAASSITCNWTSFHSLGENNYTVIEGAAGVYNITIFTESDDPLTDPGDKITVIFDVILTNYQTHDFDIGIEIRKRNTLFVLDQPIGQVPIGGTISILVFYQDTDLRVGIGNGTSEVRVTVTTPEVPGLVYTSSVSSLGLGHYNITIDSLQWGSIGWKNISIFIEWIGAVDKFYSQTIDTQVRITGTDTDLYLELAPTATYYLDTFNFTIVYWDVVGTQRITNSSGNHVSLLITALDTGHSVTQSDFTFYESGTKPGTYVFSVDSSLFSSTDSFRFRFDFMWEKGIAPLYENGTMVVTLIVLDRPTYIEFGPISSTAYGEDAEVRFSFVDTLTSIKIAESGQLTVTLNDIGVSYSYIYNAGTKEFTLYIDTASLGSIGIHNLHLNVTWVGAPFYYSVSNQLFSVNVILRTTQLSHLSFAPSQWGNNVTIEFVFTDIIDGTTVGMTGTLTLDVGAVYYTVVYSPEGHFIVTLNTTAFASDGLYVITATIVHSNPNYAGDVEIFDISILKRSTQVGYDSPDPAPYQGNVSFIVTYTDDSTGNGIAGANMVVTGNGSTGLVLNTNYWITYLVDGQYLIEVSTVALGDPGVYSLHIAISFTGAPYFLPGSIDVIARVTQRTTQILITQTPGDVAFLENVIFKFKYSDFVLGTKIVITKAHIVLSHGPTQIVITDGQYILNEYANYYEIIFNSTLINAGALETGHQIQLAIDRSTGVPYYAPRSTTTSVSTVERQTQILFPLVEDTPYYDNITMELSYIDYLTGTGIDDATFLITSGNWTVPEYTLIRDGSGVYRIIINTTIFGDTGVVYFDITMSKSGSPFYSSRTTLDVPALIKEIQTSLIAEAPAAGSTAVGVPIEILLTFRDFDHDASIEGALIQTNWTVLFGTSHGIEDLGDGTYRLTIQTAGLLAERYEFQVWSELAFYETAIVTVAIQPGAATVEIYLEKTAYYADWGQLVNITFQVREPYYNTPVTGMNATLLWDGMQYLFSELPNGYYRLILDSSDTDFGIFKPQITVTKEFYQQRQISFTLVVTKAIGQIIPDVSVYEVVVETSIGVQVYLNDTILGGPVTTATVTMEFNGTVYPMTHSGSGIFDAVLPVTGFAIGQYPLTIRAVEVNHAFLETSIDIRIVPIYTELKVGQGSTLITAYFGDVVTILAIYNDTYYNALVAGANVTYTLGSLTGILTEEANHTYSVTIDISSLSAQSIYLRITATKSGYATALKSIIVTILPIPTDASVQEFQSLQSGYYGDTLYYSFYYTDTQHLTGILGANVEGTWDGGDLDAPQDLGNGTYVFTVDITLTTPGLYDLVVRFNLLNYTSRTVTAKIEIYATPATIIGVSDYSSPINDTIQITYEVINDLDGSQITDIIGIASSPQLGDIELELLETGEYQLTVSGNLPYGTYYFDIYFSTSKYVISPIPLEITVRTVRTNLIVSNLTILTQPGASFNLEMTFMDLDHNIGISGATFTLEYSNVSLFYYDNLMTEIDGVYTFLFRADEGKTLYITVLLEKEGYDAQSIEFRIQSDVSPAQQFQQQLTIGGGFGLLIVALLIVGYVRIWSIPVLIRALNRMIRVLRKGRVPKPPKVSTRQEIAMVIVNEDLKPMKLQKPLEDIAPEPIVTTVPEVNDLLEELASITGLGDEEIEAFRADLARMKASERPGFLKEVIDQERARRADVLAGPVKEVPTKEDIPLSDLPGELEDLRKKLLKKGMASEEIDIIIQEAKSLSKADLDALLDSLGIDLE
ncbi:hypothetical protein EU528_07175 [Candidatus Thorarchaeota archaeon]|nr:MAG: hypothetical protein EU528_07175 [Candidatus Thorarchaeota archaeon]